MFNIIPKPISWYGSSTSKDSLTLHVTTNPKPKNWMDETIGTRAKIEKKLSKFQYFNVVFSDAEELEQLIRMATIVLKAKRNVP